MGIVAAILAVSFMIGIFAHLAAPSSGHGGQGQAGFLWGGLTLILSIVLTIAFAVIDGIARPESLVVSDGLFAPRLGSGQMVLIFLYNLLIDYGGVAIVGIVMFLFAVKTSKGGETLSSARKRNWRAEVS